MIKEPSFIFFDVGGVLIRDFSGTNKWFEMKQDLGLSESDYERFNEYWDKNEETVAKGKDVETLIPDIEKSFKIKLPKNFSLLHYFVEKFEKNESLWPLIEESKKKHKVGLLTNMYPKMLKAIEDAGLIPQVDWDVVVDSSIVGFAKPESEIFKIAEEQSGFKGTKILFIDNTQRHLDAASAQGWQTFLYDSKDINKSSEDLKAFLKL